jgi:hypothetical protein
VVISSCKNRTAGVKLLTKNTKSVVYGNDHQVGVAGQDTAIVRVPRIPLVRLTVNVHQDREPLHRVGRPRWNTRTMVVKATDR